VPKAVLLRDALVEELLRFGAEANNWEVHSVTKTGHQVGSRPRTFIESFAVA